MHKKISPQSKSFIILFLIALIGSFTCFLIAKIIDFPDPFSAINNLSLSQYQTTTYTNKNTNVSSPNSVSSTNTESSVAVDTTNWKTYSDKTYPLSFMYPPRWQIKKPVTKQGYYILEIDPGSRYYNMKIFVSPKDFFAMDGLPYTLEPIAGEQARNIEGILYGIQHNNFYYTFDQGVSLSLKPEFQTLVKSVKFN
jgi:hypothetical protein